MKLRLRKSHLKTSVEIDPITSTQSKRFAALIAVTVYHVGETVGDTDPRVISTYAGQLNATEAGVYAEGLSLASFICDNAKSFQGLEGIYKHLKLSGIPHMAAFYQQVTVH